MDARNENNEIAVSGELVRDKETALAHVNDDNIVSIVQRVNMINHIRDNVMTDGVHYGPIPGIKPKEGQVVKKMLLKPGIDVLCLAFEFAIDVEIEYESLANGHREYTGVGTVTHIPTGKVLGNGTGLCTTMESKYRWRFDYTEMPVPKKYWETRDPLVLGGRNFVPKKNYEGKYIIAVRNENPDIADQYNTCIKMCEKRVRSACIQNVTACSSIFEQEDIKIDPVVHDIDDKPITETLLSRQQVATIVTEIAKIKASEKAFLADYLITEIEELNATNFSNAIGDIKSGKYSPKPKAKGF